MRRLGCLVLVLVAGCQDDIATPYPPGLEPFTDDAEPAGLELAEVEDLTTRSREDDQIRVYGRGRIAAPIEAVWQAAHDPAVMVARCATTSQTVMVGNEPDYELSYLVHYFVDDIVNVEWDDQWRGGVIVEGHVMIKHQKVQGSDFIAVSEGTIQLHAAGDHTELHFIEHLDAVGGTAGDVTRGMRDNYDRLVAAAHGGALPGCN